MTRYHWVIALQFSLGPGHTATAYSEGTIDPAEGQTRQAVFRHVRSTAMGNTSFSPQADPVVLFFALEPDELGAAPAAAGEKEN